MAHVVTDNDYQHLADFRHCIREFLHFSEGAARNAGIEPQQHQLLLAIKGLGKEQRPTIRAVATRLCLRHNSTVELINRLVKRGALMRRNSEEDRREVLVALTPLGEELLERLSRVHLQQLQTAGPELIRALERILSSTDVEPAEKLVYAEIA